MKVTMRGKLQVESVTPNGDQETLKFRAVYSETKEDNSYAQATPSASAEFVISNPALIGKFAVGESYYVDFTKAGK